jgi:hypothetical protein
MPTFFIVPPRKTQLGEFGFSVSGILGIKTDLPNNAPITSSGSLLLDTSFSPTWTGVHNFNNTVYFNGNTVFNNQSIDAAALNVSGQTTGDLLYYNGSNWTRFQVGSTSGMVLQSTGSNLSWSRSLNVSTTVTSSLSIGSLNGVLKASSGVVSGNASLGDLNDVTLSSPTDTQFLKFNSSSNKWVNSLLPLPDRALIIRFLNGTTPVSLGPDQEVAIVPYDPSDGVSALVFRVVRIVFQVENFSSTQDSIVSIQITGAGQAFPDPTSPSAVFLATLTLPAGEREVIINRANTPSFDANLNSGQELRLIIDAIGVNSSGWTVQIECSTVSVNTTIGFGGILPISNGGTGRGTLGESNQILAVDSIGSKLVYKTLQPGTNVTITQTPSYVDGIEVSGTITISATGGSGGGGTVNAGTANRVAYYTASSSTVDSATHLQWDDTNNRLKVSSGPPTWSTTTVSVLVGNDFSNGDANGTVYGANISSGFGGNFADYKLNNVSKFIVSSAGEVTTQKLNLGSNTASTGTTSGALVVTGGVGIGGALNLGTQLSVANGGTGVTSATNGQILIGNSSGTFTLSTITAGAGISVTNGNGSITVAATGLASLNSLTGTSQTLAVGTSGSDFGIVSSSTTHTFNLPDAGTSSRGVVSTSSQSFAGQKTFASSVVSQKFYTGLDGYFGGNPSVFTYTGTTGSIQFGIKKSDDITHFAGIKIIEKTSPTLGSGYLYGDIVFYTDAEGEELSTERLRIDGAGLITAKKDVTIEGTLSLTNHALGTSYGGTGLNSIGTSNSILGVNNGASGLEYKTLVAGSNVTINHSTSSITISAASPGSSGITSLNTVTGSSQTFVNDTNVTVVSSSVANTHTITWSGQLSVSRGGTGTSSLTGLVKGSGTSAFTAASSGVDYAPPTSGASLLYGNNSGGFSNATVSTGLSFSGGTLSNTGVTSVGLSLPSIFTVSTSTVTTTGTLTAILAATSANYVLAGPTTGSATTPAFRALVAADIPSLNYAPQTSGTSILYGNGSGGFSSVTVSTGLSFSGGTLSNTGVTSVGLSLPNIFTISTSTVTTTGTLTATLSTTTANYVFAGPTTGSATTPAFRTLVAADIPSLNYAPQTSGTSILYGNGSGGFSNVTVSTGLSFSGGTLSNTGVTSVGLSLPSIFTVSTSTVTTTGTLTAVLAATTANYVLAGPTTGSATTPAFRALVAADIPNLDASKITTGTVATARLATGTATTTTFLRGDQTWATVPSGSPAGSNGQIQFNNATAFGGATYAIWNTTDNSFNLTATPTATSTTAVFKVGSAFTAEVPALGDFVGSTSGTIIAVNTATSFVGNQIDLQNGGSSIFKVDYNGNTTIAATTTSTSSTTGALKIAGGVGIVKDVFIGGKAQIGTGTYTKTSTNDLILDNGSNTDTAGVLYYYNNNTNIGTDVFNSKYRIVKDLNESTGAELWSINRSGVVTQTGWRVGESICTKTYNYSDLGMSSGGDPVGVTTSSYTTIATASYTPTSNSSYLWIEFSATYDYNNGSAADEFAANIEVGGTEIINVFQKFVNATGGGTRSGVLFPLSGRYTNSGTSSLSITVRVKRSSGDDTLRIFGNAGSGLMRIQEIGR